MKLENIEDEVVNGGLAGSKRVLSFLQSHVDSHSNSSDGFISKMSDVEKKKMSALIKSANDLLKTISTRTLNMISSNNTYKSQIRDWQKKHGKSINTKAAVAGLISDVESKLNKSIVSSKRGDTRRKRELEKKIVMTFYKNNKDEIKKIFDLQYLIIQAKSMIEAP